MAENSISVVIFDEYDVVFNDLYSWEIINPSSSDDDDLQDSDHFSFTDQDEEEDLVDDVTAPEIKDQRLEEFGSSSSDVSVVSPSPHPQHIVVDAVMPPEIKDPSQQEFGSPSSVVSMILQSPQSPPHLKQIALDRVIPKLVSGDNSGGGDVTYDESDEKYDEEQEDDDDEMENDDLYDDELVPFGLSNKFVRQRIRKMGKKAYGRKKTSKKMPHYYSRPGCVYGKHGLGVQYYMI